MLVKSHSPKFKAAVARPTSSDRVCPATIPRLSGAVATRGISSCFEDDPPPLKSRSASVAPPKTRRRSSTKASLPSQTNTDLRSTIHVVSDPPGFQYDQLHTHRLLTDTAPIEPSVRPSQSERQPKHHRSPLDPQTPRAHHHRQPSRGAERRRASPSGVHAVSPPEKLRSVQTEEPAVGAARDRHSVNSSSREPSCVESKSSSTKTTVAHGPVSDVSVCDERIALRAARGEPEVVKPKERLQAKDALCVALPAAHDMGPSRVMTTQVPATSASSCSTSLIETPAEEQESLGGSSEVTRHLAMNFEPLAAERIRSAQMAEELKFVPPLACLAPKSILGRRVCVCRTPTRLAEPVGNVRFQQPTLDEVKKALKALSDSVSRLHGSDENWVIWELSSKRESIVQQMAPDFRYQMLPYRVNDVGLLPLSLMVSFVSTILFWLDLDPVNVAVIMFYEDNASYLCLLTSLLLALEHFTSRHARAEGESMQSGLVRPRVEDVLNFIDPSLYCKQSLSAYQRSPTSYKINCVEPFMVLPQLWPVMPRRCLHDFQSLLAMYPAKEVVPLKAFELKSISVSNFIGPVEGLSVEIYHMFTSQLIDGKLRESAKRKRVEQRRDRNRRAKTHRPSEVPSNYSFLSLTRALDTPGRTSVGSRSTHKRERSGSVACPSMASSRSRATPHIEKEDDLLWEAVERSIQFRKECPTAEKPDMLFNALGGFKHHSKPRPEWDDISTVLVPTTESRRVRVESTTQTEKSCSATFNFQSLAPKSKRRSKTTENEKETPPISATLCGDVLIVLRQRLPQPEQAIRHWNSNSSKPSSDAHSVRKPTPVVALHALHTSFIRDGLLTLSADDFEFFKFVENHLVPTNGGRSEMRVDVVMSGVVADEQKTVASPGDDLESCKPHSASEEDTTAVAEPPTHHHRRSFPSCVRATPMRTTVPTLDMSRVSALSGTSPDANGSARKRLPFYYKLVGGRRNCADTVGLASPASSPRLSEMTNRSRKWPTILSRTARQPREETYITAQITLLPAQWWQEFCLWRLSHSPLLTAPDRDLEEFCFRHIVEVDPVKLLEWPEENGCDQIEALCCMKVSDHVLNAIMYAQQHFSLGLDDSPLGSPRGLSSEATTVYDELGPTRKHRQKAKRPNKATALITKMKFKSMLFTVPGRTEPKKKASLSPRAGSLPHTRLPRSGSLGAEPLTAERLIKIAQPDAHWNEAISSPSSFPQSESPAEIETPPPPPQPSESRRASMPAIPSVELEQVRKAPRFTMSKPAVLTIPPDVVVERVTAPVSESRPAVHPAAAALTAAFAAQKSGSMRRTMEPAVSTAKAKAKPPAAAAKKKAPPPSGGGGLAALFAKKAAEASASSAPKGKAPLGRRLFWKPLENHEDTVFDELANLQDGSDNPTFDVDPSTMTKVFVKSVKKPAVKATKKEEDTKTYVTVLDAKRAQNVGIVVLRLRLPADVIANNLRTLTPDPRLTTDDLQKLEGIIFTPEEDREVTAYLNDKGDPGGLRDIPERRLLPLRNECVPRGKERCRALVFNEKWRIMGADLSANLEILEKASQEMRQSKTFRQVLSVVLKWGNFVNYGATPELQIKAITLSSLLKLTEFKTTIDASVTSLHYILANMLASAPEINLQVMSTEMSTVKAAAKIGGESLEAVWRDLCEGAKLLRTEKTQFASAYKSNDGKDLGFQRLDEMLTNVEIELSRLEVQAQRTLGLVMSTARFFGDDSVPNVAVSSDKGIHFAFGSVFSTFNSFLRKFDEAIIDIGRRPQVYSRVVPEENIEALLSFCQRISAKPKRPPSNSPPKAINPHKTPVPRTAPVATPPTTATPAPATAPVGGSSTPRTPPQPKSDILPMTPEKRSPPETPVGPRQSKSLHVTIGSDSEMKIEPKSPPARLRKSEGRLVSKGESGRRISQADPGMLSAGVNTGYLGRTVGLTNKMVPDSSLSSPVIELGPSLKNLYNIR